MSKRKTKKQKTNIDYVLELLNDSDRMMQIFVMEAIQNYSKIILDDKENFINENSNNWLINPHHWVQLAEKAVSLREAFFNPPVVTTDENTNSRTRTQIFKGQYYTIEVKKTGNIERALVDNVTNLIMLHDKNPLAVNLLINHVRGLITEGYIIGNGSNHIWIHKEDSNNDFGIWITLQDSKNGKQL